MATPNETSQDTAGSERIIRSLKSWVWALTPAYTMGLLTAAPFLIAAVKRKTIWMWLSAGLYIAAFVSILIGLSLPVYGIGTIYTNAGFLVSLFGGSVHTLCIRRIVWDLPSKTDIAPPPKSERQNLQDHLNHTNQTIDSRGELRTKFRDIAMNDPMYAKLTLKIGRPDLADRPVDDGGLVDVNHAPVDVLVTLPGINAAVAQHINDHVAGGNTFTDIYEMTHHIPVDTQYLHILDEYAIFLP
ncbi:hypothetical protein [Haloglycomyces albus]|uniref:hypothetical protein n=1 Tax=Haloglycomyces albus TaxID=526067 RepID=UPI00046D8604|nr:hypothetical protein [Haloglycomyces albus]